MMSLLFENCKSVDLNSRHSINIFIYGLYNSRQFEKLKKSVPLPEFEPRSSQSDFINDDLDRSATWLLIEI